MISPVVMSPVAMSVSPSSSKATLSPPFQSFQAPQRRSTAPSAPEPLTFTKVAISPAPSAVNSTDSEACFSDVPGAGSELSRSPSLLTSLIRCQAKRSTSGNATTPATTPGVSPHASPLPNGSTALPRTRPILRRSSTGANTSNDERPDTRLQLAFGGLESVRESTAPSPLQRKRSCLKFAVTPRPLQLPSANSSRRSSRTSPRLETLSIEDEEDEVATPWDSDDAGYQEDSEDGFTSDEDDGHGMLSSRRWPPKSWKSWTPAAVPPPPILSTPRRRSVVLVPESTTDDGLEVGEPRRRKIRIRADDEDRKCSRHRSPPPSSHISMADPAPPAARSPSAYELCRRRSGVNDVAKVPLTPIASRGWRSDDAVVSGRKGSLVVPGFVPSVKVEETKVESKVERKRNVIEVARRDSAPACVDEVHVLGQQSHGTCPVRGLRRVLGQ